MIFSETLKILENEGNLRRLPSQLPEDIIDFTSNDYLGLASNRKIAEEFISGLSHFSFSTSASRLLASQQEEYQQLEKFLEKIYNRPALLFNSGYHANTGIIPALASGAKTLIIADKLVHASIIDGIILSRADFKRFPHNDIKKLEKILTESYDKFERIIVITEGIFSMEGDEAPAEEILNLKKNKFPEIILYLDEAHSFGVKGENGKGLAHNTSEKDLWDILIFPLGKAAASMGAFVITNQEIKEILINRARSLIFSTALPPLQIQWTRFALEKLFEMNSEREKLKNLAVQLSDILTENFPASTHCISHIQPLIIGDPHRTLLLSEELFKGGIKVLPIRKPTVPPGSERLRFSLSSKMNESNLIKLNQILSSVKKDQCNLTM